MPWERKFLDDDLSGGDIEEGTSCQARENNRIDFALLPEDHPNHNACWSRHAEGENEPPHQLEVVRESLDQRYAKRTSSSTLVDANGEHDIQHVD